MILFAEGFNCIKCLGTTGSGEQTYWRSCQENVEQTICFNLFLFFLKHFICVYPSLIIHTWAITTDMKAGQSLRSAASRVWRGHVGFTLIFKALVMWFLYWDVGSWTQPCPDPPRLCLSTIKTVTGWCIKTAAASSIRTRGYCVTVSLCQSSCICMYVSMYVYCTE